MWRKPLNSAVLVAATHRRLERAFDKTSTQVVAYIINKLRAKISRKQLYNVRDPLERRGLKKIQERERERERNTVANYS